MGEVKTIFEWELFGVGVDAGQTTIRLRHAWGELGAVGVGQTWSPFMDPDIFPNTVEYWGPSGMPLFRNVQLRWMPMQGDDELFIALERPGASADGGVYADHVALAGREDPHSRSPTSRRTTGRPASWGHFQVAGILRQIKWDDMNADQYDLSGSDTGWGLHASTNLKVGERRPDPGLGRLRRGRRELHERRADRHRHPEQLRRPEEAGRRRGDPAPRHRRVLRARLERRSSTRAVGYSYFDMDNPDGQAADAFDSGHYALGEPPLHARPGGHGGGELQWGQRKNFTDGYSTDDFRVQFSFKYNFSWMLGGKK